MIDSYYVAFCKSDKWYARVLRDGFSHVMVFKKLPRENKYIQVNPVGHIETELFPDITKTLSALKKDYGFKFVRICIERDKYPDLHLSFIPFRWGIYNCVIIAKYMLGFRSWCLTPYGLWKALRCKAYVKKNEHIKCAEVV